VILMKVDCPLLSGVVILLQIVILIVDLRKR